MAGASSRVTLSCWVSMVGSSGGITNYELRITEVIDRWVLCIIHPCWV